MNYTEETALIIFNASNDERSKDEEFIVVPPLSLWGERIMYYINFVIQRNIRSRKFKFKGHFKVADMLKDLNMALTNRVHVREEIESGRLTNTNITYSKLDDESMREASVAHPMIDEISIDRSRVYFKVNEDYMNRNITRSIDSFYVTTIEEIQGYKKELSFKLARWIKSRTNARLNYDTLPKEVLKNAKKIRDAFRKMEKNQINSVLEDWYMEKGGKFDPSLTHDEHIKNLTGWNAKPYIHFISLNEIRRMMYGNDKTRWKYTGLDDKGKIKKLNKKPIPAAIEKTNFINGIIKKALKEIDQYSIFNVSLPVFQEEDFDDPYNKILKIVVSPKPFILSDEVEKVVQDTRQNIKLAVLQNYLENHALKISKDIPKIDISEEMIHAAKQISRIDDMNSKGDRLVEEVIRVRTGERKLSFDSPDEEDPKEIGFEDFKTINVKF